MSTIPVGIDLGTTYSAVARLDDLGRPHTVVNGEGDHLTPSVILVEGDQFVIGKEAVKAMATEMDFIAECAKRDLGQRVFNKVIDGRQYPPEALQALILNKLREDTEQVLGPVEKVVITVPAYFDEVRRKATQDAGYIAGLEVMDIINEPTAAAIAFGFQHGLVNGSEQQPRNILVYDLGGGTFDVTVMEIRGREFNALATDGDVELGGRDWDQRLMDHVAEEFIRRFDVDPRQDPNTMGRLWRECEDAKRTLSAREKASVACEYQGHALRVEITRTQFEELSQDLLDRTAFTTRQTLQAAGLEWSQVERILMVGGSSRMPQVRRMLRELSGKEPDGSVSPDEAVAHGAALRAGLLLEKFHDQAPPFSVRNVNSHSLGVIGTEPQTGVARNAVVIPRNTPLPAAARRVFRTQRDNQKSILVRIIEGESTHPEDCSQIGQCTVRDLPAQLPARSPIEVRFRYLENGRLTIKVRVAGQSEWVRHAILRENGLSQDQLDRWRLFVSQREP